MKMTGIGVISLILFSCGSKEPKNQQWYENQIIEQINKETDSTYNVQIGINAQAFRLDRQVKDFEEKKKLLEESMNSRKKINIGIEKGTSRIISVKE